MDQRRLFIVRHANAAQPAGGPADHERPLTDRGRADLPYAAAEIAHHLDAPLDLLLCSTATRARETAQGLLAQLAPAAQPRNTRYEQWLYLARPDAIVEELALLDGDVRTVLVCGHNPTLHALAVDLIADAAVPAKLAENLPTAGVVVLDFAKPWSEVGQGGTLVAFSGRPE